jgi:tetraacyldisaccharide 4'-kinase
MTFFENKWPAALLWPVSLLYALVISFRNFFYDHGLFKSYAVESYVISVGNITVGGTGKTPTVQYLAKHFLSQHFKVAIISRGYKRKSSGPIVVSDGERILADVKESGDEPFLLAKTCLGAIVIVDSNRVRAAQLAVKKFQPHVILLDDAFQHRRIRRNFDLLTMRRQRPFGNGFCLPAGPLRELRAGLSRAHAILFNGAEKSPPLPATMFQAQIFAAEYVAAHLQNRMGQNLPLDLKDKKVVAFCGLANPESFRKTLQHLGVNFSGFVAYNDHYDYQGDDINNIYNMFQAANADLIITTEKDWVKLPLDLLDEHWTMLHIDIKPINEHKLVSLFEIQK